MIWLGVLSYAQIFFLPGLLFNFCLRNYKLIDRLILIFFLSLIFNHTLCFVLIYFETFNQLTLLIIFFIELFIYFLFIFDFQKFINLMFLINKNINFKQDFKFSINFSIINFFLVVILSTYVFFVLSKIGTVFEDGDQLYNWVSWAKSLVQNQIPINSGHYPHLLSSLYSINFLFIGSVDVKFFAVIIPTIFPLLSIFVFLRIAELIKEYKFEIKLATLIFAIIIFRLFGYDTLFDGLADPLIALYAIFAGYLLILLKKQVNKNIDMSFLFFCGIISGSFVTKQSGIFIACLFPFVGFFYNYKNLKYKYASLFAAFVIILIFTSPYILLQLLDNDFQSNAIKNLSLVSENFLNKILQGPKKIFGFIYPIILIFTIFGLNSKLNIKIFFFYILPIYMMWAYFFSYDFRNFTAALPALSLLIAFGIINIFNKILLVRFLNYKILQIIFLIIFLFSTSIYVSIKRDNERLFNSSISLSKQIGNSKINYLLYHYYKKIDKKIPIYSTYQPLRELPDLGQNFILEVCVDKKNIHNLIENKKEFFYLTVPWCNKDFLRYLKLLQNNNVSNMIFEEDHYTLYLINSS